MSFNMIKLLGIFTLITMLGYGHAGINTEPEDPLFRCVAPSDDDQGPELLDVINGEPMFGESPIDHVVIYYGSNNPRIVMTFAFLKGYKKLGGESYPLYDHPTIAAPIHELEPDLMVGDFTGLSYRTEFEANSIKWNRTHIFSGGPVYLEIDGRVNYQFYGRDEVDREVKVRLTCKKFI